MTILATWGYGVAASAFFMLSALLGAAWQGRAQGLTLVGAVFATSIWALVLALISTGETTPPVAFLVETLRQGAWLVVVAGLVRSRSQSGWLGSAAYLLLGLVLCAELAAGVFWSGLFRDAVMFGGLGLSAACLILLDQAYRSSDLEGRWALRYLYIGVGGMAAFDLYMYSEGLLLGVLGKEEWAARGFVFAVAVPLIAIAAKRNPRWSLKVFVSRDASLYATGAVLVGGYLLLMAAGGYAVRLVGGTWTAVAQIVFLAGAIALLAALMGSAVLRRRIRVFLVKHFYRHKYEYRDEWLRFISTLSEVPQGEDPKTTAIRAVAQIIASPGALLLRRDESAGGYLVAGSWPAPESATNEIEAFSRDPGVIRLLGTREWVIDLLECHHEPELYDQLIVPERLIVGDWRLVVPVLLRNELFGILFLKQPMEGFTLTFEDRDLLKTVGRHIATHVAQHEAEQRLVEAQQFEAYSKLTAFLMHDLKNAVAQLQLVVDNARRHKRNPEFFDDAIETVGNTAGRLSRLIEQLRTGNAPARSECVELAGLVESVVERCATRKPKPSLVVGIPRFIVNATRDRLADVIEHVIRNAQEATAADGEVAVRIEPRGTCVAIIVQDDGCGMSAEFVRGRLFRAFDSTKGVKGMGIGAYQARELARSMGGEVDVRSEPGRGTRFEIIVPARSLAAVS